ncbi:MAG: pyrimidine regulatory protein PyrR [uncultured bacterium]|nr:MAG: pyrimidine regulatory protein PyrR [uncultured bacterium]
MNSSVILTEKDISRILMRMSHEIIEQKSFDPKNTALVGILTRGVYLARRIQENIQQIENVKLEVGSLDISFHRDDLDLRNNLPMVGVTDIPFDIEKKTIILVDDVLYTGRTVRAALDEIIDFGRPSRIQLAVLIDRGHRELPIRPDFVGKNVPSNENDSIKVHLKESDERDEVLLQCQK